MGVWGWGSDLGLHSGTGGWELGIGGVGCHLWSCGGRFDLGSCVLEAFQFALGAREGALKALLGLPDAIEQENLLARALGLVIEIGFCHFDADQFPLGDGHLLNVIAFGGGVGLPLGFEFAGELLEIIGVFSLEDDSTGAEAVADGIRTDGGLSFRRFGSGAL